MARSGVLPTILSRSARGTQPALASDVTRVVFSAADMLGTTVLFLADQACAIAATCSRGAADGFCPLRTSAGLGELRTPPVMVEERLQRVRNPLAWAGGINLERARGAEWNALVGRAKTLSHLRMIARARGFK